MTTREKIDLIARTDPFELVAEIERLRKERAERNAVIEECARVAESTTYMSGTAIAAAIRALKDKP